MTQYIYIASPTRLPKGSFGSEPSNHDKDNCFKNDLDYEHLFFESNYEPQLKQRFSYSSHFSFDHQVGADARQIPIRDTIKGTMEEEKCLAILYSYLSDALHSNGVLEYYTCVNGREDLPTSKRRNVRWTDINNPYDLVIRDREFWVITF
ncbi:hypothetical protein CIB95_04970 [Lottiidibacillus patelloidae]|uniref:Uncharacterized protein n=1 Tax=Lottiidibacillus patelloidae TaxID=2670334 RepID=A0A263BVI8_9BACI|nr:hypothetical protein [Lottiidibacillus patelloidae]OZM57720.1 hypothetical protein CIB95_04970 [Lottiidibacillus patelloidae]